MKIETGKQSVYFEGWIIFPKDLSCIALTLNARSRSIKTYLFVISPLWNQLLGDQNLCFPIISISIFSFIHQVIFESVTQPQQKLVDSWLKLHHILMISMKTGGRGEDKTSQWGKGWKHYQTSENPHGWGQHH